MKRSLAAGQELFHEGDPAGSAYLIESGTIAIVTHDEGREVLLSELGAGAILGEMAVIDAAPRTATARAVTDVELIEIDRGQIAERIDRSDPVVRSLLEGLLKRYRNAMSAMRGKVTESEDGFDNAGGMGKIRLESQLRDALASDGLDLRLQPLLEVPAGVIGGYEALVRWTHPERGPVSPAEFIALAEETSLIVPVGEYVLDKACQAIQGLHAGGTAPFVAINVSARQLAEEGLIDRIVVRTRDAGLPQSSVKVEITESLSLDYGMVAGVIAECHGHGIKVAMDDFGTGYSGMEHLHRLAFDTVKVDQAYARNMHASPRAMAILRNMVAMVHDLGADVVVEGIEEERQLDVLRELGVRYAQGYLIGKPQPLAEWLS
ncbi:MAG: EAL domain-containing protein [Rhodanobacteraceae bacterium]|nr:EAL domain-containing protein [Rhodanobacteraceae bacterium]HPF74839.1 EAL domain-containing protein [Xanthomonadaceae bacterium]HRY00703.1 EAL domain-containing protein [Xanthomonadaceae bacterium]